LTVLSPDRSQLAKLAPDWATECAKQGLIPGRDPVPEPPGFEAFGPVNVDVLAETPFVPDTSKTNLTSIGFLFEFEGKRIVFTGDADDRRLVSSLRARAVAEGGKLRLDALKVAHHGSDHNLSNELLEIIDCRRYLMSTSGARHGHPNNIAIARILKHGGASKEIAFNYRERAHLWDVDELKAKYGLTVVKPPPECDGFVTLNL
jgi:hypothetical protein